MNELKETLRAIRTNFERGFYPKFVRKERVLPRGTCRECRGNGEFINDSADYRGEHKQEVEKCGKCGGTGRL
jgi:hypothetical protein